MDIMRLYDILNSKANQTNPEVLKKTNPVWEVVKKLFICNVKMCKSTEVCITIQKDGLVLYSVNSCKETKTNLNASDAFDCIYIAKSNGLAVQLISPQDFFDKFDKVDSFIIFSFTPSNIIPEE